MSVPAAESAHDRDPDPDPDHDPVVRAQDEVAAILGDIAELWGFTRTQGRIFGLVFMSPEALDQRTIRERLSISAGSTSMTIHSLVEWGVLIRDDGPPVSRYEAETNFFKLITQVMRQREREWVDTALHAARRVVESLRAAPADDPRVRFALQRGEHMLAFFEMGSSLLDAFVERGPVTRLVTSIARRASALSTNRRDSHVGLDS
jgi:DNA-binding transcriptional regulator GbsR (MarR family)